MTNHKKPTNAFQTGANIFFAGVFVVVTTAFCLQSLAQFADTMTLLPLVLSGALLVVALIVGAKRGEYGGFVFVVVYGVLAGFTVGLSGWAGEGAFTPYIQRMTAALPWLFSGVCGLAVAFNAGALA